MTKVNTGGSEQAEIELKLLKLLVMYQPAQETPSTREYVSDHLEWTIPIGNDHTASIVLDIDAYNALLERVNSNGK